MSLKPCSSCFNIWCGQYYIRDLSVSITLFQHWTHVFWYARLALYKPSHIRSTPTRPQQMNLLSLFCINICIFNWHMVILIFYAIYFMYNNSTNAYDLCKAYILSRLGLENCWHSLALYKIAAFCWQSPKFNFRFPNKKKEERTFWRSEKSQNCDIVLILYS